MFMEIQVEGTGEIILVDNAIVPAAG